MTNELMREYDDNDLLCTHGRMVTDKGIYVCPILIDFPDAKLGDSLDESFTDYPLGHSACYTCYVSGAIFHNFPTGQDVSHTSAPHLKLYKTKNNVAFDIVNHGFFDGSAWHF